MSSFKNSTVLITGGASGIGKLMGQLAIERGAAALIILDIDKKSLTSTVKEFSGKHANAYGYTVDASNAGQVRFVAAKIKK